MGDRLREAMDGTLGHFWMNFGDVYNLDKAADGYVRLAEDDLFHIGGRAPCGAQGRQVSHRRAEIPQVTRWPD